MEPLKILSAILGWVYFLCWSVSFYPQAWQNFKTKSVTGLSVDYMVASVVGFLCYAVFAVCMYAVEPIRRAYRERHRGKDNLISLNDVIFAVDAFFITSVMLVQIVIYRKDNERISKVGIVTTTAILLIMIIGLGLTIGKVGPFDWLFYLYLLSYIKLGMTVVKYIPQVWLNYSRKSTHGWNVYNVILDFTGGIFSTAQLILDAVIANHLAGIGGVMIKLGLGVVSIFFDVIFLLQHYVWFRHSEPKDRIVVSPKAPAAGADGNVLPTSMPSQEAIPGSKSPSSGRTPEDAVTAEQVQKR